ncbi:type I-E CRISPR-associated protein Cse2/CasB [Vibrio campbellii]|uniref:type I-E CRISPR-associated protein Cse2/CasB n=1 Tax=Vibrio campbellii TaxID=680 RepID=UPI000CD3577D|nr:type I-E CRISPR-associated protein Cse2/CasB [Vibrio campbellii]
MCRRYTTSYVQTIHRDKCKLGQNVDLTHGNTLRDRMTKYERCYSFVDYVKLNCRTNKRFASSLNHADYQSGTESNIWDLLCRFDVDIENDNERIPFILIGAAIARGDNHNIHTLPLGRAIYKSFPNGDEQGSARLRRLISCDTTEEVCNVLRPLLGLLQSKIKISINYAELLCQLIEYSNNPESVRMIWTNDFYRFRPEEESSSQKGEA